MKLLESVKFRCGIPSNITIYDENELIPLIDDAIDEMATAGVPEGLLPADAWKESEVDVNPRVLTTIVLYVQTQRGQDRSESERYYRMYRRKLTKLMLEPEV